jgi:hypothetical protein
MKLTKYVIEVSEEQAQIISSALDIYSRLTFGQISIAFQMIPFSEELEFNFKTLLGEFFRTIEDLVFYNNQIGIAEASESGKIACDIHQVIRHRIAWDRNPKGENLVWFDEPFKYGKEELVKIKMVK